MIPSRLRQWYFMCDPAYNVEMYGEQWITMYDLVSGTNKEIIEPIEDEI